MAISRTARASLLGLCAVAAIAGVVAWITLHTRHETAPSPDARASEKGESIDHPRPYTGPTLDPRALLFRECAAEVGITFHMHTLPNEQGETFKINLYDHGCGLAVGDFDGDGRDDIYFVNQLGPNALYRNRGDGTFVDVAESAGVALGDRVCVAATFVDYDNDGKQDLFVTSTRGGNVLFHNVGGKFEDVTKKAGVGHVGHSQNAVFFDYDNDGLLDLFVTNTAKWTNDIYDNSSHSFLGKGDLGISQELDQPVDLSTKEFNILYRNNGDGTFTDVTAKAGLQGRGWAGDAAAFDYNDDGHMDLFVTSMFGRAQLYRNNGDNTFTDVTLKVLGRTPWGGTGTRVFDFNNDGRLDLFVVDMHSDMWMGLDFAHHSLGSARKYEKKKFRYFNGPNVIRNPLLISEEKTLGKILGYVHEEVIFGNGLYRNDGGGKFTEVSDQAGLETFWPWGIAAADYDNDGREDIFIPSGMGYPFYYWPNYLMMNRGDGTFRDRAEETGIEPLPQGIYLKSIGGRKAVRSSRCAASGDFDGDGRLEIVVNNFNDRPYYFKNQTAGANHIAFRLRGTKSNRDAIGAVVRLFQDGKVQTRQIQGAGGYLSQSSKIVHFGLGDQTQIDKVEIAWPSGERQTLRGDAVSANSAKPHVIVEGERGASAP